MNDVARFLARVRHPAARGAFARAGFVVPGTAPGRDRRTAP